MRSNAQWQLILSGCGVSADTASLWAPFFANAVTPDNFPGGDAEIADFLGEVLWESNKLTELSENLNYSAQSLLAVFGKHITADQANTVGRTADHPADQVAIANIVYGNRLGNTEPNDGWLYRGSGPIQITGKANFNAVGDAACINLTANPDLLRKPCVECILLTVAWWKLNVEKRNVDYGDLATIRGIVNGPAELGLTQVVDLTSVAAAALTAYPG
jgi:putative chitinase